jgi:hypothetical protein
MTTFETIINGLLERKLITSAKKVDQRMEGSKLIMLIPNWPIVEIGRAGGISLPQIKSYQNPLECVWDGPARLAAQTAREVKAAAAKALPVAPEAKKPNAPVAKTDAPKAEQVVAK